MKNLPNEKYETEVFQISGLCWKQRVRRPLIPNLKYEPCTASCHDESTSKLQEKNNNSASRHDQSTSKTFNHTQTTNQCKKVQKAEDLSALQFISESDLLADQFASSQWSLNQNNDGEDIQRVRSIIKHDEPQTQTLSESDLSLVDKVRTPIYIHINTHICVR